MQTNPIVVAGYDALLKDASEAWKQGSGDTDAWARAAMTALLREQMTPEDLALSVYKVFSPHDARGRLARPKRRGARISVRNLENSSAPVKGAGTARKNLEAVLLLFWERALIKEELDSFCSGSPHPKLYGLVPLLKQRMFVGDSVSLLVELDVENRRFVEACVENGDYQDADAVFAAALSLLRDSADG